MKKLVILFVLLISAIVVNAAIYRVKYDVHNKQSTSFIVKVESGKLTVRNNTYHLRRLGTITNSGLEFNSYVYGSNEKGMFCVSTTTVTVEINPLKKSLDMLL